MRPSAIAAVLLCATAFVEPASSQTASAPQTAAPAAETTTFGDWVLRCFERPNALPCDIVQVLSHKESKAQLLAMSIAYSPRDGKHAIQMNVPLGIDLRRAVDISIGKVTAKKVPPSYCEASGCVIEAVLADDMLAALKTSGKGKVLMSGDGKKDTAIEFSLKGFGDAETALKRETAVRMSKSLSPTPDR